MLEQHGIVSQCGAKCILDVAATTKLTRRDIITHVCISMVSFDVSLSGQIRTKALPHTRTKGLLTRRSTAAFCEWPTLDAHTFRC